MAYALREGISYCEVEGRLIFLDLAHDRYFCLSPPVEAAFRRMARGDNSHEDAGLVMRSGLVVDTAGERLGPCIPPAHCTHSLFDVGSPAATIGSVAIMLFAFWRTSVQLRLRGLDAAIQRHARAKARMMTTPAPATALEATAAAARACMRIVSLHERCLPASLALATRLASLGVPADLVLGVRLSPFKAHAWVQSDTTLINERLEIARLFTPILVL